MAAPLIKRRSVIAAKAETTPGTAESLAAAEAAFNAFNVTSNANIDFDHREGQGEGADLGGVPAAYGGTVSFSLEITGDGAGGIPGWASVFLPACGWVNTSLQIYGPTLVPPEAAGSSTKTLTIGFYEDGRRKLLRGCMGSFVIELNAGRKAMINFTFSGVWGDPTDVALLAPTYPTVAPIRWASSAVTLGGSGISPIATLSADAGNNVTIREDATDASGYHSALVTSRRIVGSIDPESNLVADNDYYGDWTARTQQALAVPLGATNNKVTIAVPKLQFTNIQDADRNGMRVDAIDWHAARNGGNDEMTLTFA